MLKQVLIGRVGMRKQKEPWKKIMTEKIGIHLEDRSEKLWALPKKRIVILIGKNQLLVVVEEEVIQVVVLQIVEILAVPNL